MLRKLWDDEQGAIIATELLVITTILVIGLMAAWVVVRNAVIVQINDQAEWISGEEEEGEEVDDFESDEVDIITCSDLAGGS